MWLLSLFAERLRLPNAPEGIDRLARNDRLKIHQAILQEKPYFTDLVVDLHQHLLELVKHYSLAKRGSIIEVGAGVIPLSHIGNEIVSSDVEFSSDLSCIVDAMAMPFSNASSSAVIGQNVLHHIPDPDLAFDEFRRILSTGGVVVLVEPYFGWFASLIYPALFSSEGYNKNLAPKEDLIGKNGLPMPNQAMSYKYFEAGVNARPSHCPDFTIVHHAPVVSGLRYLLSGALNFRRIAPRWLLSALRRLERGRLSAYILRAFAIHWVIVLRKSDSNDAR